MKTRMLVTISVAFFFLFSSSISDARSQFPVDLDPEICTLAEEWQIQARDCQDFENVLRQWHQDGLLIEEPSFEAYTWTIFHTIGYKAWTVYMVLGEFLSPMEYLECLGFFNFYNLEMPSSEAEWNKAWDRNLHAVEIETILTRTATKLAAKSEHVPDMIYMDFQFVLRDSTRMIRFFAPWERGASGIIEGTIQVASPVICIGEWYDVYVPYKSDPLSIQCTMDGALEIPQGTYNFDGGISIHHHSKTFAEQGFPVTDNSQPFEYPVMITLAGKTEWYGAEKTVDQSDTVTHRVAPRINILPADNFATAIITSEIDCAITNGRFLMNFVEPPAVFNMNIVLHVDGRQKITVAVTATRTSNPDQWYSFQVDESLEISAGKLWVIEFRGPDAPIKDMKLWFDGYFDIQYNHSPSRSNGGGSGGGN